MSELREVLDQAMESILDRGWAAEPGTFAVIVKVDGERDWPSIFVWSPAKDDSIETLSLWRDPSIGQWMAVLEEGHGSIELVTTRHGMGPSFS